MDVDTDNESTYSRHGIYPRTEWIGNNYSQQLIPSDDLNGNKVKLKRSRIRHKIILAQFMRDILRYPLSSSRYLIVPPRWRSGEYPSFNGRRLKLLHLSLRGTPAEKLILIIWALLKRIQPWHHWSVKSRRSMAGSQIGSAWPLHALIRGCIRPWLKTVCRTENIYLPYITDELVDDSRLKVELMANFSLVSAGVNIYDRI